MRSCVILLTKLNTPCTEGYRSGHNGADSKGSRAYHSATCESSCFLRLSCKCFIFLEFWMTAFHLRSCKSRAKFKLNLIRRDIEVVITGLTRNFLKSWPFAPLKKPINTGFSPVRKLNILLFFPSVLSKSFWKKCGITYTESCPSGRRCSTRNH